MSSKIIIKRKHLTSGFLQLNPVRSAVITALASTLFFNPVYAADEEAKKETAQSTEANTEPNKDSAVAEDKESTLGSVVVTANRRQESAQEVSTAISVLNGKDLTNNGIGRSAQEVFNYVPNATAVGQQHGRPRWWIRGVGAGQQQLDLANPIGFYLDEVYISNSSATGFPIFDLERVEVLRGPQGTKYGKNATGGAVNIISKKPSLKDGKTDDYIKVDYGTFNDKIVEGGVNVPIVDDTVAARISFFQEDTDGRFKNLFDGSKDGGLQDGAIRGQLLAKISDNTEALLNLHYRKYKTEGGITTTNSYVPSGVFRNGYIPRTGYNEVNTNAPINSDTSQDGANLNFKTYFGKLAFVSISAYEGFRDEFVGDNDNTPLELSRNHGDRKVRQFSQEFRLSSPKEDQWNWLAGVHLFNEKIDSLTQAAKLPATQVAGVTPAAAGTTVTFNSTDLKHETTSFSIFGSTTYNWTDKFETTAGLSWATEKKEYDLNRLASTGTGSFSSLGEWWNAYTGAYAAAGTLASGTFKTSDSQRWNRWSYDITPEYKITPTDRVFFKYAHGFKSGGFNTAATNLAAVNQVKPEELDSYELGYKSEWLDGSVNFNATAFHYDYSDVQVNVVGFNALAGATVSYLQNAKRATVNGAEFEIEAVPTSRLHLAASLGLLDTEYKEADILNNGGSFAGNQLVRSPHVTANIAADYRIPLGNGSKVILGGDARYLSKQYYYVTPQGVDANGFDRKGLEQDGFTVVNARISYVTPGEKYTITAYANNLFDEEWLQHSTPAVSTSNPVINGDNIIQGGVRTVGVSFIARF